MQSLERDRIDFEGIYRTYYPRMKRFAQEYVVREEDAENITQDIFMELWESRALIPSHTNLFSFLFTTVKNRCTDFLRHQIVVQKTADKMQRRHQLELKIKYQSLEQFDEKIFGESDLETVVNRAIGELPERCRQIFVMNKLEGKKQKDIAQELDISIHTVESQMGIAYKRLRDSLKDYLPLLIFFLG